MNQLRLVGAGVVVLLWQWLLGSAVPGTVSSPSTDPGLCLALAWVSRGGSWSLGLWLWTLSLVSSVPLQGSQPLWTFLLGWPVWLVATRMPKEGSMFFVLSVLAVVVTRCGGKLLLLGLFPDASLTLSGTDIVDSLWAEAASAALLISFFRWAVGNRR